MPHVAKIPIADLAKGSGILAREIAARDGSYCLPAGLDISLLESSLSHIIDRLKRDGIDHVYIDQPDELSDEDLDRIADCVYSSEGQGGVIKKEKAFEVIKGVNDLYSDFKKEEANSELVTSLSNMGEDIARDLMENPSVAFSLGRVKEADEYTFIHSFNVSILAGYLANRLHPSDHEFTQKIVLAGLMHDVGKSNVPPRVLNKPGPLDRDEFEIMKRHPLDGVEIAQRYGVNDDDILGAIGQHHEKWAGTGYPNRIAREDITEAGRITAVADVFDALTAQRVYKPALSSRNAISMILKDSGVHFDPVVGRELLVGLGLYPPGSIVELSDGRQGVVVSGGGKDLVRPIVLLRESVSSRGAPPVFVDLKIAVGISIKKYLGHGSKRGIKIADGALASA